MWYGGLVQEEEFLKGLSYYPELEKISKTMQSMFLDFPFQFCNIASRVVHLRTGLQQLGGDFYNPYTQKRINKGDWHAWNYDPKSKLHLCLTLYQYDFGLPIISAFPDSVSVLVKNDRLTDAQRKIDLVPYGLQDVLDELENRS